MSDNTLDIHSALPYPSGTLSNFTNHPFDWQGNRVESLEGFFQGLRFKEPEEQRRVWLMSGVEAKREGKRRKIINHTLYLYGKPFNRHSEFYQVLIRRVYFTMAANSTSFRRALLATGNKTLTHSIGKSDPNETMLTVNEFCGILTEIRNIISEVKYD